MCPLLLCSLFLENEINKLNVPTATRVSFRVFKQTDFELLNFGESYVCQFCLEEEGKGRISQTRNQFMP